MLIEGGERERERERKRDRERNRGERDREKERKRDREREEAVSCDERKVRFGKLLDSYRWPIELIEQIGPEIE
jgi:hypothetical protein